MSGQSQYDVAAATTPAPESPYCLTCGGRLDHADAPDKADLERAGAVVVARMAEWARTHRNVIGLVLLRLSGDEPRVRQYADALMVNHSAIERAMRDADGLGLAPLLRGDGICRSQSQRERRAKEREHRHDNGQPEYL